MKNKTLTVLLSLCILSSCSTTKLASFTNPKYNGQQYKNICVGTISNKLGDIKSIEDSFVEALTMKGVKAVPSYSIISPTQNYSNKEVRKILKDNKIDALLMVTAINKYATTSYVPPTYYTQGNATYNQYNNTANYNGTTQQVGGYNVEKPKMELKVDLISVKQDLLVWSASSYSRGNTFSNYDDLASSCAREVRDELNEKGFIVLSEDM